MAKAALASLADRAGMSTVDLAASIVEITNENMASAIKMVSLERGYDPRRFTLFGFGGAGPLHAAAVARSLRMPRVLIPMYPGNASALGMLLADLRVDKVWTQAFRSSRVDAALVARQFAAIREAASAELREEGFVGTPEVHFSISMRYAGQNYEHQVPVPAETMTEAVLRDAFSSFERIHAERYGYAIEGEEIELVAFHVTVTGRRSAPRLVVREESVACTEPTSRLVHFRGKGTGHPQGLDWGLGHLPTKIYRRYALPAGTRLDGPCILEEPGSTTLLEPGMTVEVLPDRQLLIGTGVV